MQMYFICRKISFKCCVQFSARYNIQAEIFLFNNLQHGNRRKRLACISNLGLYVHFVKGVYKGSAIVANDRHVIHIRWGAIFISQIDSIYPANFQMAFLINSKRMMIYEHDYASAERSKIESEIIKIL